MRGKKKADSSEGAYTSHTCVFVTETKISRPVFLLVIMDLSKLPSQSYSD